MLGGFSGLTECTVGYARDVFLEASLGAFAHKIGELDTEVCCTQRLYVHWCEVVVLVRVSSRHSSAKCVISSCHVTRLLHRLDVDLQQFRSRIKLNMDVNFRKIDIDAYDEDVLLETELYDPDPRGPQQASEDAKARAASVRTSLAK